MAIMVTMLATANGSPYTPASAPTINIWRVTDGVQVITNGALSQVGSTFFWKYSFASGVYGVPYVYTITGDLFLTPPERVKYGTIFQEVPDRVIGTVQADVGNSALQFKSTQTESTNDHWKDTLVVFLTGNLTGQVKKCTAYNGTSFIMTFASGFTTTPANGDTYEILNL